MLEDIKKVHLVGVGGIGISALARFFLSQKKLISGSDLGDSFITEDLKSLGAKIFRGHAASNLDTGTDLLVYSDAVPYDNPERAKARELRIKEMSYFQFLGTLSRIKSRTIAVSGNKGKTTTTAMLASIMEAAKLDPTAILGSYVNEWNSNFRAGDSSYFIVEGDEWREHMNELNPWAIVLTNIAPDHLDYFGTFENEVAAFQKYVNKISGNGFYFYNADDRVTAGLKKPACKVVSYGIYGDADLMVTKRAARPGSQVFNLSYRGKDLGEFKLKLPGLFNIYNALAAAACALELQVSPETVRQVLASFAGTWRRFQVIGQYRGAEVISDYAHHPAAVEATIKAAKEFYPGKRVVAVFQPHHHHRTKSLFNEFVKCLDEADCVILPEIYRVAGRDGLADQEISSLDLVNAIRQNDKERGVNRTLEFVSELASLPQVLEAKIETGDVLLMMGAGDIYKVAEGLGKK